MKFRDSTTCSMHNHGLRTVAGVLALSLVLAADRCSSSKIVKRYTGTGAIHEIIAMEEDSVKYRIVFEYDQSGRISSVSKYLSSEKKPAGVRTFSFDGQGKLRLQSHRETHIKDGRAAEDSWVESYFYNNSGDLVRTEASYKSSLSIALHKTPLVVTHYYYKGGRIEKIIVYGGLVKKELALAYRGSEFTGLEYGLFSFSIQDKKYTPSVRMSFNLKRGEPYQAQNRLTGAPVTAKKEILKIYADEKIADVLKQPELSQNVQKLLETLEKDWMQ